MAMSGKSKEVCKDNNKAKTMKVFKPCSQLKSGVNRPCNQVEVACQEVDDRSYSNQHATFQHQEVSSSEGNEAFDVASTEAWSHLETQGYETTSQMQNQTGEYEVMEETKTYELGLWAYETSDANLTLAEKLEKRKWEAERLQRV